MLDNPLVSAYSHGTVPYTELAITGTITFVIALTIELVRCIRDIRKQLHRLELNQEILRDRLERGDL